MLANILINGLVISSVYALGAIGFTLVFGVSGVLNLAHGGTIVVSALIGWFIASQIGLGIYPGIACGCLAGMATAYITYFCIVRPLQRSTAIPPEDEEVVVLTATMIFGYMIELGMAYVFTNNPVTINVLISGVTRIFGARVPNNNILIVVTCWCAIGLLWLVMNRTRIGKAMLAASMNTRGVSLLGFDLAKIYSLVWTIYGLLAGLAGVLLATYSGTGTVNAIALTASAFSIVVLGGLGSVGGSLIAALIVGYFETLTAYLISPVFRPIPALVLVILVVYSRPQGLFGRLQQ